MQQLSILETEAGIVPSRPRGGGERHDGGGDDAG
jgi:hypothetical protein